MANLSSFFGNATNGYTKFTASGTFTPAAGVNYVWLRMLGSGYTLSGQSLSGCSCYVGPFPVTPGVGCAVTTGAASSQTDSTFAAPGQTITCPAAKSGAAGKFAFMNADTWTGAGANWWVNPPATGSSGSGVPHSWTSPTTTAAGFVEVFW